MDHLKRQTLSLSEALATQEGVTRPVGRAEPAWTFQGNRLLLSPCLKASQLLSGGPELWLESDASSPPAHTQHFFFPTTRAARAWVLLRAVR